MTDFSLDRFHRFCSHVQINSKEFGVVRLEKLYGPQRWIGAQIAKGLQEDVHDFTILKCRQLGASTFFLCLDLYWPFTHPGIDGTVVTQDEKTFINFRTQLTEAYNSLPRTMKPFSPQHNRAEFVFRFKPNDDLPSGAISRLQYQVAGTREGGATLGRAKGNAFGHMTEVAFWGDQAGIDSLKNSFAEQNPMRLFVWESTANGFNQFEEMCRIAKTAVSQRFIFVSWWAHELYRCSRDDQRFRVYWGQMGRPTREERMLARDVALLYGDVMEFVNGTKEITPEQFAWYRWYQTEKAADPDMVQQEMPWTEQQAFVTTGAQYFSSRYLTDAHKRIVKEPTPTPFRVEIQQTLSDCKVYACVPRAANLQVYAAPIEGRNIQYVLGADPAYGSSDWADRFVISVWRCWADRVEQVAEYATADCLPYAFAWVMCYLAGCYAPCGWNLEINGPGAAVLGEIESLKRQQFAGSELEKRQLRNFLGGMQEFFYTRFDSIQKSPQAKGTQSTLKEKTRYMDMYKGYTAREIAVPHSRELLQEMRWVTQEPGCAPGGNARHKDDRVIAAALAVQMWHDKLRGRLMQSNVSYMREVQLAAGEQPRVMSVVEQMVARQTRLLGFPPTGSVPPRR